MLPPSLTILEPVHEISNNVVCAASNASDQPAHTRSLIRAFASRLSILWLLSYWLNTIWSFLAQKEAAEARPSVRLSKCQIVGNLVYWLKFNYYLVVKCVIPFMLLIQQREIKLCLSVWQFLILIFLTYIRQFKHLFRMLKTTVVQAFKNRTKKAKQNKEKYENWTMWLNWS